MSHKRQLRLHSNFNHFDWSLGAFVQQQVSRIMKCRAIVSSCATAFITFYVDRINKMNFLYFITIIRFFLEQIHCDDDECEHFFPGTERKPWERNASDFSSHKINHRNRNIEIIKRNASIRQPRNMYSKPLLIEIVDGDGVVEHQNYPTNIVLVSKASW